MLNIDFNKVAYDGRKLADVLLYGYKLYNYDMILVFSDPYVEAQAMGCPVEFSPYPRLLGPCDLKKSPPLNRTGEIIKAAKILQGKIDVPVFVSIKGPFSLASFLVGIEDFLKLLVRDGTSAKGTIEQALDFQLRYLEILLNIGVNIMIGDPMASASVIAPELFRRFAYSPLKEMVTRIKKTNQICAIHICGVTNLIINDLDKLGADVLSIEDVSVKAETLKMGGVKTETILSGNTTMIEKEVKEAMQEKYLILATSCDVPPETTSESIETMIGFGNEFGKN